jgi:CRISPR/Cas system CMR-associated protein Cmr1 (group 7 of RAMP superfamily)
MSKTQPKTINFPPIVNKVLAAKVVAARKAIKYGRNLFFIKIDPRSFWQQKVFECEKKKSVSPMKLFFGCKDIGQGDQIGRILLWANLFTYFGHIC